MKTYLECLPCFLTQALKNAKLAGADVEKQKKILDAVAKIFPQISLTASPPEIDRIIKKHIVKITQNADPFKEIKKNGNILALNIYDLLKKKTVCSNNRLLTAVRLAISGNIIDYGAKYYLHIEKELGKILKKEYKTIKNKILFNFEKFKDVLNQSKTVLYLADNAGETVFDRILIEEIKKIDNKKRVIYAVKEKPAINDALREDAVISGIDKYAEIISCGADTPGTVLKYCSKSFIKIFEQADMIISKGQGNFEALSNCGRPVFFLLIVKCSVIAGHISSSGVKCKTGDTILYYKSK